MDMYIIGLWFVIVLILILMVFIIKFRIIDLTSSSSGLHPAPSAAIASLYYTPGSS